MVVDMFCKGDVERFDYIRTIISKSIPSNPLEMSLVKKIYHHTTISSLFDKMAVGLNCYDQLCIEFPEDSFLYQQKALFLASYNLYDEANEAINKALKKNPGSSILINTQGTIILKESLKEKDTTKSAYLRDKGKNILLSVIKKGNNNVYHYHMRDLFTINVI